MIYLLKDVVDQVLIARDRSMLYLLPADHRTCDHLRNGGLFRGDQYGDYRSPDGGEPQTSMYRASSAPGFSSSTTTRSNLISRFINDVNLLRYSMAKALTGLVKDSLLVIFLSMILIFHNWSLALPLTVFVFPLALYPTVRIGKRIRKISRNTQVETGDLTTILDDIISGRAVTSKPIRWNNWKPNAHRTRSSESLYSRGKPPGVQAISRPLMESLVDSRWPAQYFTADCRLSTGR